MISEHLKDKVEIYDEVSSKDLEKNLKVFIEIDTLV